MKTEFEQYFGGIISGKIVACDKMKKVAKLLMAEYKRPGKYHFDYELAKKHTDFIELFCKQPSGKIGSPLKLQLFQKARLQALFGFVDKNNIRQFNECLIIEGRKNGKTTETAAVEIDMLVNDGEGSPQIYNIATKHDQAKLGFNAAYKMIKQSDELAKHIRKRAADLYFPVNFGYIKAMASNVNSLDGLDTHCGVIDELAAIKNRDLYDLVKQSMGARVQPILFQITTNGFVRENIFDAQYDYARGVLEGKKLDRFLPFIYELDDPSEWDKEECWIKANPGLDTIKSRDYLRQMVKKAKDDLSFMPTVLCKDFNLKQTSETAWLRFEDLNNEEMITETFDYCIGGFDAADAIDLNAAVALMQKPGDEKIYVKSMFWIPSEVLRQQELSGNRRGRDSVPYDLWIQQGYMRTCPGNKCDKSIFLDWFCELRDECDMYTLFIGYDPWHIDDTLLKQFKAEFGQNSMIPVRQGALTCSEPLKNLAADFKAHRIVYDNNPVMKWNLINAEIKTDVNNNIQLVHAADRRRRNDGAAALMDAYKVLMDKRDSFINMN